MTEKKTERTNPRHWAGHLQRLPDANPVWPLKRQCDLFFLIRRARRSAARTPFPSPALSGRPMCGAPCFSFDFRPNFLLYSY